MNLVFTETPEHFLVLKNGSELLRWDKTIYSRTEAIMRADQNIGEILRITGREATYTEEPPKKFKWYAPFSTAYGREEELVALNPNGRLVYSSQALQVLEFDEKKYLGDWAETLEQYLMEHHGQSFGGVK